MTIGAFLLSFVLATINGAQIKLVKPIFDNGMTGKASLHEFLYLAGALLVLGLLNFPARFYHFYWMRFVGEKINNDVRDEIFSKLQKLPTSFYNQNKQGRMLSTLLNDAEIFAQSFKAMIDCVREPIKGFVYLSVAVWTDWQMAMVIVLVGPLFVAIFQI